MPDLTGEIFQRGIGLRVERRLGELMAAMPRPLKAMPLLDHLVSSPPTPDECQNLWPRGVGIPRLTSSAAMVYGVVMPFALMSVITGASAMALTSARCFDTLRPAARASGVATIAILPRGDPSRSEGKDGVPATRFYRQG